MKHMRKILILMAVLMMTFCSATLLAKPLEDGYNIKEETIQKNSKSYDILVSQDGYVQITQPTKIDMSTFAVKLHLMGETKPGTKVTIAVYHGKQNDSQVVYSDEPTITYQTQVVGITGTFNQLLELLEGSNKVVLKYNNTKDDKDSKMVFYITRESEETKNSVRNYITLPSNIN